MIENPTVQSLVEDITKGLLDEHLTNIQASVVKRLEVVAKEKLATIQPGTLVRLGPFGSGAKYLNGLTATFLHWNDGGARAEVELTETSRARVSGKRYGRPSTLCVPRVCLAVAE